MLIQETEHWRFTLIPEYRRKPYVITYEEITCPHCLGRSGNRLFSLEHEDCNWCNNSGVRHVEKRIQVEPKPEIPQDYIDHMKKAHQEYINGKSHSS